MRRIAIAAATIAALLCALAPPALGEGAPQWTVTAVARPTNFTPGSESGEESYRVLVMNTGEAASNGEPVMITDELPEGLRALPSLAEAADLIGQQQGVLAASFGDSCHTDGNGLLTCTYDRPVQAGEALALTLPVAVASSPPAQQGTGCGPFPAAAIACVDNVVRVSGGGANTATVQTPTLIDPESAPFGVSPGGAATALSNAQAGAHADITTSIAFNTVDQAGSLASDPKNTVDNLPPGFAGDLADTPTCSSTQLVKETCPIGTQVGVVILNLREATPSPSKYRIEPVYNLPPDAGEVGKLAFKVAGTFFIQGDLSVRADDYGITATFHNVDPVGGELDGVTLTIWGVPADESHNALRWNGMPESGQGAFGASSPGAVVPYSTNPTSCTTGPLQAEFLVNSWQNPGETLAPVQMPFGPIYGCDRLLLQPSLSAEVTSDSAFAPTGLILNTIVPQTYENPAGLATPTLEREVVTLPEGITVNPSAGAGLQACSQQEFEEEEVAQAAGHGCPPASKLGTMTVVTPSLKESASGSVYIAQPYANQFGSLIALYVVARIPNRGVLIKLAGKTEANPLTGQLVTTFENLPPLPFSLASFKFRQGATSPLITPPLCGDYQVQAQLTSWATPLQSLSALSLPFSIDTGANGAACPTGGALPFAPRTVAGTENNVAGNYSPFYLRIEREDGEQEITGFATQLPAGLTGNLSGIAECGEAEIARARQQSGASAEAEPACPAGSEIGYTVAEAGVGSVLAQTPGKLYLGGPFEGAPFSIVSVTSAKVGPFDLGTVVVHLPLRIDPATAQVSVPSGPADQIPHIIDGIVIHLRTIRVYIDRHDFMINPTSCEPTSLTTTVIGGGANPTDPAGYDPVTSTSRFQAADCSSLKFEPTFAATASGKTSKADGTSLNVAIAFPKNSIGAQANIHEVKVELPRQLPVRQSTLPKACTAAQFDSNPAGCDKESIVGHAKAITPILPVPLEGPAYFVSHGGAQFPDLDFVLQGDGVTIILHGETYIGKSNIISTTFKTVPDQPVSSFELTLPKGPYSALTNNGSLCHVTKTVTVKKRVRRKVKGHVKTVTRKVHKKVASSLVMPTTLIAQNGLELHQNTVVAVSECAKARKG